MTESEKTEIDDIHQTYDALQGGYHQAMKDTLLAIGQLKQKNYPEDLQSNINDIARLSYEIVIETKKMKDIADKMGSAIQKAQSFTELTSQLKQVVSKINPCMGHQAEKSNITMAIQGLTVLKAQVSHQASEKYSNKPAHFSKARAALFSNPINTRSHPEATPDKKSKR